MRCRFKILSQHSTCNCLTLQGLLSDADCPIYCFGHSSSQSVSQWNSFPPLKYIVYKCFSCFRPGMAVFFHRHTCHAFFCCIIRKYLSHIYLAVSSRLLKWKFLYITYCTSLYNILCWRYQSWRRYLLQSSRRYSTTRCKPLFFCAICTDCGTFIPSDRIFSSNWTAILWTLIIKLHDLKKAKFGSVAHWFLSAFDRTKYSKM